MLKPGDRLLVSELSRLGRSLSQVIQIVDTLGQRKIHFIAIKECIEFDAQQDLRTKVMIALFGLFAEVERDLISERTKEGLAAAKAKGKLLGRPKGALGTSRLDGKEQDIRVMLGKKVSKASLAKILDVSAPPSTTSSRPARSLRADYNARDGLMLYFNTNMGATPSTPTCCVMSARSSGRTSSSTARSRSTPPSSSCASLSVYFCTNLVGYP